MADVSARSAFLIEGDTVRAAWMLGSEMPDVDAVIAALRRPRPSALRVSALWATWPAVRHIDGHYLARPAAGYGEAAAGDHLQLGWAFWLPGHQLEQGAAPWVDPYSFRPEADAPPNLQGWLLGLPFWPLRHLVGNVWAYNLIVLLSIVAAGALACWWLRALGRVARAALVGGLVFALAPYRVGQSTGHLLGLIAFLLPADAARAGAPALVWAALALAAIPLSGQIHLAMGAVVLALGYAWARSPRPDGGRRERRWLVAAGGGDRRPAGCGRGLDRGRRPFLRPGRALLRRAVGLRHARRRSGGRGVRLPRLAGPSLRSTGCGRSGAGAGSPGSSGCRPSSRASSRSAPIFRSTSRSGGPCHSSASHAFPSA